MNQSVFLEPAGSSGSPVEPPVRTVQPRFDLNPVQMTGSDRNGDRSTVGPVRPAGPVRFLKHWWFERPHKLVVVHHCQPVSAVTWKKSGNHKNRKMNILLKIISILCYSYLKTIEWVNKIPRPKTQLFKFFKLGFLFY